MKTTAVTGWPSCRRSQKNHILWAAGLSLALLAFPLTAAQAHPPTLEETGGPSPVWGAPPFCGRPKAERPPVIAPASPLRSVEQLPPQAVEVSLETPRFYVHEGIFFTRSGERFVVVPAPVGAIVPTLPAAFTTLSIDGLPHYLAANVFYRPHDKGYVVVPSPLDPAPNPPPPPPLPCHSPVDSVTMTVHLTAGGTGTVVLTRHGHGWIGPKGEIYERLPSEQQLAPLLPLTMPRNLAQGEAVDAWLRSLLEKGTRKKNRGQGQLRPHLIDGCGEG